MPVQILYFAWVRELVGVGMERIDLPGEIATIAELIGWLAARSEGHAAAMADPARLRAAIDQRFVSLDAPVAGAREIALFPPVTGG
ncbi:molybdopterin converting factor subunit 1 [Sphingomonas gilva]|uniref:Molybdopterin converting factor subunit 1 n=1 Tax=Sphingomonas gilva TaxID=2305907 RepID=A0A396RNR9_9SPHN|nr:molybdopterin converting factor subunit 1 [Sphingomonas gilva]RHW17426.1 molybdopterin converting factor subunit 1 [Sphingomonas gilva]